MVHGDNKGHKYEKKIGSILLRNNVTIKQTCTNCNFETYSSEYQSCHSCKIELKLTAGSGTHEDLIIRHNGKDVSVELKNNLSDPDWGQCALIPREKEGNWIWNYSGESKNKKPKLIKYYEQFKFVDGSVGLLEYLNNKKIIPNKYRISNDEMTFPLRKQDQKNFEDCKHRISTLAFSKFHEKKSDYVQIGQGYGFFHISNDSANIGTRQFDAEFTLRFRAKTTNRHFPLCPKCNKECNPGTYPKCNSCKIKIPKSVEIGKKCSTCIEFEKNEKNKNKIVPYKEFNHRDDQVEFVVVINKPKLETKSEFNIETLEGNQKFPPFKS